MHPVNKVGFYFLLKSLKIPLLGNYIVVCLQVVYKKNPSNMAALISVDAQAAGDENQRYRMPAILTTTEGRGNGIKTVFTNIRDIAAAIFRNVDVLHMYFGLELGARATFDPDENKYYAMGDFPVDILQRKVYEFIERFVLCRNCRSPETDVEAGPRGTVVLRCRACGAAHAAQANERITNLLLRHAAAPAADAAIDAASVHIGERPDIFFPTHSDDDMQRQQGKVLDDVCAVVTNPTLPRDQVFQKLVNIKTMARLDEADLPRMIIRGAVRNATSDDIIQCLRVAAPQLQLLTARQGATTTNIPAYTVIFEEIIYLSIKAKDKLATIRIPMVLRMLVEEGVLELHYVKEFFDSHYDKMLRKMTRYGFTTSEMEDLATGMAALKDWMGLDIVTDAQGGEREEGE